MMVKVVAALIAISTLLGSGDCAITLYNQAVNPFNVTILTPCLNYRDVYSKRPALKHEEYVNVRGCPSNFGVFTLPVGNKSVTVVLEEGAYVLIQDYPGAQIAGYLLDKSGAMMSTLFTL